VRGRIMLYAFKLLGRLTGHLAARWCSCSENLSFPR